ncbi:hypothetical protein DFH09DRAFT_627681 [Mycena vulgaris]|nr:hypothetical protein DFH09DRAFT_627681 [Mycena vulgaris]
MALALPSSLTMHCRTPSQGGSQVPHRRRGFWPGPTGLELQVQGRSLHKSSSSRFAASAATNTPAPFNASLPFKLSAAPGKYRNLGYGADIELYAASGTRSQSPYCASLVANLNRTFPAELAAADLVWAWNRQLADYGALFNLTAWFSICFLRL